MGNSGVSRPRAADEDEELEISMSLGGFEKKKADFFP